MLDPVRCPRDARFSQWPFRGTVEFHIDVMRLANALYLFHEFIQNHT